MAREWRGAPLRTLYPVTELEEARSRYTSGERVARWRWREDKYVTSRERKVLALMVGFTLAQGQPDVDPWQALLREVTRCHHRILFYEDQIARTAQKPEDLLPGGKAHAWIVQQGQERKRLAETTKVAIAAGIMARTLQQLELDVSAMVYAARAALDTLDISQDEKDRALEAMGNALMRAEANPSLVLESAR